MLPSSQPGPVSQFPDLFRQVFNYPFSTDREFQQGLRAILHSASSPEEAEALTLDAQCFYYTRCVDFASLKSIWTTRILSFTTADIQIQQTHPSPPRR